MASFCSLSQDIALQIQTDVENDDFVSVYLLSEEQIQSTVNATVNSFKNSASIRITSFINHLKRNNQANYFISALNTNAIIRIVANKDQYVAMGYQTIYVGSSSMSVQIGCGNTNEIAPAVFNSLLTQSSYLFHLLWFNNPYKRWSCQWIFCRMYSS